ncbi:unnamed protein product [Plutella xylostella]|uniref:(diamondback moth) hypothetical protein n=1 Tax=Plutella xylostella TaxID=51655 RepID=A0A8S4GIB5_PLUXY|nr:unnamed protein product [Plutella xylostella]
MDIESRSNIYGFREVRLSGDRSLCNFEISDSPSIVSEEANDTQSQFVDAFSRKWEFKLGWIFPPPSMIPRVLHHLNDSKGTYLLVAPVWEKPHWYTKPIS